MLFDRVNASICLVRRSMRPPSCFPRFSFISVQPLHWSMSDSTIIVISFDNKNGRNCTKTRQIKRRPAERYREAFKISRKSWSNMFLPQFRSQSMVYAAEHTIHMRRCSDRGQTNINHRIGFAFPAVDVSECCFLLQLLFAMQVFIRRIRDSSCFFRSFCGLALLLFQLNAVIEHQSDCEITQSFNKRIFFLLLLLLGHIRPKNGVRNFTRYICVAFRRAIHQIVLSHAYASHSHRVRFFTLSFWLHLALRFYSIALKQTANSTMRW